MEINGLILRICGVIFIVATCLSCQDNKNNDEIAMLDIQGHRGARGLMPENSIPAFIRALELGVHTLELDLAVSKDSQLIVSHEPYMSGSICTDPTGNEIPKEDERSHNIYAMGVEEIQQYDCGSKGNSRFPDQKKINVNKPRLLDVLEAVNDYLSKNERIPPRYNIEIKSHPKGDTIFHPRPEEFSDLVYAFIQKHMDPKLVTVQSFDFRVLQYIHKTYPEIQLAALVENDMGIDKNLDDLGFLPEIYSCDFTLLEEESVIRLHEKNILVIPWTVNKRSDMDKLISWGVDGLITDYPDRAPGIISK